MANALQLGFPVAHGRDFKSPVGCCSTRTKARNPRNGNLNKALLLRASLGRSTGGGAQRPGKS
jgi:hypothetical protein